ncbi:MAG: FAD-dependent oxidoreductase [Candidatus Aminicenantes bacterium]|nr:FAD-dependent oxidoreductase [Candidatus Aminicenantes bacterium]
MKYKVWVPDLLWYRTNILCMEACPVHTDSGRYVQLIGIGEDQEAYLVARSSNPFASVCGRICAAPCEDACRRGKINESITIRSLKKFVTEKYGVESKIAHTQELLTEGKKIPQGSVWPLHVSSVIKRETSKTRKKVAVVGGGPSGLACAHDLALRGYQVTIFEASNMLGGMPRTAIPEYRLPKDILRKEAEFVLSLGVEVRFNTPLSENFGLDELKKLGFEAFYISVGAQQSREPNIEGTELEGVFNATDYLLNINQGYKIELGRRTVIIGGGLVALDSARTALREVLAHLSDSEEAKLAIDISAEAGMMMTAIDVARTALRRGTLKVDVASLESFEEMPATQSTQGKEEFEESVREGITFHPSRGPKRIIGEGGQVKAVEFLKVKRVFDEKGRFNPELEPKTEEIIEADSVILAIGQRPDLTFIRPKDGVEITPQGTIKVDPHTLATTREEVFAGGDAAFGARILIEGVANGKVAAHSIDNYLRKKRGTEKMCSVSIKVLSHQDYKKPEEYEIRERKTPDKISLEHRTGANEVELSFEEKEARSQAQRCLICHINTIYDSELCILCGACVDHCPNNCLKLVPFSEIELEQREIIEKKIKNKKRKSLTAMIKDEIVCIRCGICADVCPTRAMTMERFSFREM